MKAASRLAGRLGPNIQESVGSGVTPLTVVPPPPDRYDGTSRLQGGLRIPVDQIVPDPDQPRREFDEASLFRLAADLRERGQLQPVRVRWDGGWKIVTGERRWRAAVMAKLETLDCVEERSEKDAEGLLEDQLVENCQRDDLCPVDRAAAFRRLMDRRGWTASRLAERLNLSETLVTCSLALLKLPEEVRRDIRSGEIAARTAYELTQVKDPDAQREIVTAIREKGLSRSEVQEAVRSARGPGGRGRRPRGTTRRVSLGRCTVTVAFRGDASDADVREALLGALRAFFPEP